MQVDHIKPGVLIQHNPSGRIYEIEAIGQMRLPGGGWVAAARYVMYSYKDDKEYYRPLDDFTHFALYVP